VFKHGTGAFLSDRFIWMPVRGPLKRALAGMTDFGILGFEWL
jgi:hypothetical protein